MTNEPARAMNNIIADLVSALLYYDRQEDEEHPPGWIEAQIEAKRFTVNWIVSRFREELVVGLARNKNT